MTDRDLRDALAANQFAADDHCRTLLVWASGLFALACVVLTLVWM